MDYTERLVEIFGSGKGPSSLRTIFDCDSTEWTMTTMEKKTFFLEKMLQSGYPLLNWIEDYTSQYRNRPDILRCIQKSIGLLEYKIEDTFVRKCVNFYVEDAPKRNIRELSRKFLFNAYFNLKDGIDVACIKRAYRDLNRTLSNFEIVENYGQRDLKEIKARRKAIRLVWQKFLEEKISELKHKVFEDNEEYDTWHYDFCFKLTDISNHKLKLGQAQKWINMIIKYLVVFGEESILRNIKYFHIPIDSLIMEELHKNPLFNIRKLDTPWSKIDDWNKYIDYQKKFRTIVGLKNPLEVEFEIFNKILLRNNLENE